MHYSVLIAELFDLPCSARRMCASGSRGRVFRQSSAIKVADKIPGFSAAMGLRLILHPRARISYRSFADRGAVRLDVDVQVGISRCALPSVLLALRRASFSAIGAPPPQSNSVPSRHMAHIAMASRRATATVALW